MDILHQVEGTMEDSASSSRISENPLPESGKETEKAVTLEKKPEDASSSRMETPRDTVSGVEETEAIEAPETKGMEQTLSGNSSEAEAEQKEPLRMDVNQMEESRMQAPNESTAGSKDPEDEGTKI
jgi:hypothetical protein